jgi:hypothetical protein
MLEVVCENCGERKSIPLDRLYNRSRGQIYMKVLREHDFIVRFPLGFSSLKSARTYCLSCYASLRLRAGKAAFDPQALAAVPLAGSDPAARSLSTGRVEP